MPTIVHFEIPADDIDRAKKFYSELFKWKINGVPGMEYWLVTTSGGKAVGGGMMKRRRPGQTITNYIDVPSISEYSMNVQKLGGKVIVPKTAVPKMGYFSVCLDTENNIFGLWEDDISAQ